jgi:hypothetical protein
MDKIRMDAGRAREDCIRMQLPLIYSVPKKDRPGMVEIYYDLSTVQFRSETGGVSGVSLTEEARRDLYQYLDVMKNKGIAEAGNILHPPGQTFPEHYDRGWLLIPEKNEETVARDLETILKNPHNWVLEDWAKERQESILHRLLAKKRQEWDQEKEREA